MINDDRIMACDIKALERAVGCLNVANSTMKQSSAAWRALAKLRRNLRAAAAACPRAAGCTVIVAQLRARSMRSTPPGAIPGASLRQEDVEGLRCAGLRRPRPNAHRRSAY